MVEGLPTVVVGIATWFLLPDSAQTARFLNEEERAVAKARGVRQVGDEEAHRIGHIRWKDIGLALLDLKVFSCTLPSLHSIPSIFSPCNF